MISVVVAFVTATLTTPVGVSGAVFLVPVQLTVLGVDPLRVSSTNLVYNVVAIPGALAVSFRRREFDWMLTGMLIGGGVPGVIVGAMLRTHALDDVDAFLAIVAAVLLALGVWLLFGHQPANETSAEPSTEISTWYRGRIVSLAAGAGVIGGIYGIGGGSLMAPLLVGMGLGFAAVAPAALLATFTTSVVGVATFAALSSSATNVAPDWKIGVALGLAGLAGAAAGAWMRPILPESVLRRVLGMIAILLALRYGWQIAF